MLHNRSSGIIMSETDETNNNSSNSLCKEVQDAAKIEDSSNSAFSDLPMIENERMTDNAFSENSTTSVATSFSNATLGVVCGVAEVHSDLHSTTDAETCKRKAESLTDSDIKNKQAVLMNTFFPLKVIDKSEPMDVSPSTLVTKKTFHNPDSNNKYWEGCSTEIENSLSTEVLSSSDEIMSNDSKCKRIIDFSDLEPTKLACSQKFSNGNFFKGSKWSPDGLCFLTNSNDNHVRLFNTPISCLHQNLDEPTTPVDLKTCFVVQESGCIFDFVWYPLMNSQNPATCCFASTAKDQPIHLWDAFDGSLRASYIHLNSVQEVQAAHSLCFSPGGGQLLCGLKK